MLKIFLVIALPTLVGASKFWIVWKLFLENIIGQAIVCTLDTLLFQEQGRGRKRKREKKKKKMSWKIQQTKEEKNSKSKIRKEFLSMFLSFCFWCINFCCTRGMYSPTWSSIDQSHGYILFLCVFFLNVYQLYLCRFHAGVWITSPIKRQFQVSWEYKKKKKCRQAWKDIAKVVDVSRSGEI